MMCYKNITLLITHYNRTVSLERLLHSIQQLNIFFAEIIVSDDGSDTGHIRLLHALQQKYPFRLITTAKNQGLGANINKGQRAVVTPYILYVQEDFEIAPLFITTLKEAYDIMETDTGLDLVRFFAHFRYPYLKPYNNNFEEVAIPALATDYNKIYSYSDTPHLRRATFEQKFGPYREDLASDRMEYRMCISFIVNGGRCIISNYFSSLFIHDNLAVEPSTAVRPPRQRSRAMIIAVARFWFRQLRYNWDLIRTPKNARAYEA
ncbi:hypothetical protein FLA_4394 [Filimonas lacunae]|nr:hypothetical protein FLA_4394 [Filimonas lacunae]